MNAKERAERLWEKYRHLCKAATKGDFVQDVENEIDQEIGVWLKWVNKSMEGCWYYTYELPSGELQTWALAESIMDAIENARFHAQGRRILISSHPPSEEKTS